MRSPLLCPALMVPTPYKNLTSRTWNLPTATIKPWALFFFFSSVVRFEAYEEKMDKTSVSIGKENHRIN